MLQRLLWPALCAGQLLPALWLPRQSGPVPTWQLRSNHWPVSPLPSRLRRRELWQLRRRLLWRRRHRQKLPTWVDAKTCPQELWWAAKVYIPFYERIKAPLSAPLVTSLRADFQNCVFSTGCQEIELNDRIGYFFLLLKTPMRVVVSLQHSCIEPTRWTTFLK